MRLQNEFTVNVPVERAWEVLTDIPAIAPCLPGAKLTGHEGAVYSGTMKIKVGPATADYSGTADFLVRDADARHVEISAKGKDKRGSGNASAVITADMTPDGEGTRVTIDTNLKVSGKVAQFGKGVMAEISEKLIGQFVDCVEQRLLGDQVVEDVAASGAADNVSSADTVSAVDTASAAGAATKLRAAPDEVEALDLMDVAGGAMAKRIAPVIAVIAVLILLKVLLGRR
jgi:carbon monoxide dehydrogenase subunit G